MEQITLSNLVTWLTVQTWSDFAQSLAAFYAKKGYLTDKQEAAARKMHAKCMAKAAGGGFVAAVSTPALDVDGIFVKDGEVFKVQWNHEHTSLYTKKLVETEGGFRFDYAGKGPLYKLTEADRLTAEKAAELGKLYGVCIRCSKVLTDEDSIHNGYGKTCAGHMGWPYEAAPALMGAAAQGEQLILG